MIAYAGFAYPTDAGYYPTYMETAAASSATAAAPCSSAFNYPDRPFFPVIDRTEREDLKRYFLDFVREKVPEPVQEKPKPLRMAATRPILFRRQQTSLSGYLPKRVRKRLKSKNV